MMKQLSFQKFVKKIIEWNRRRKAEKKTLQQALDLYQQQITSEANTILNDQIELTEAIYSLHSAIETKIDSNIQQAQAQAEAYIQKKEKRNIVQLLLHYIWMFALALAIATLIRQTCCEMYEIPTGSMRPTFKEKDRVLASKTTFGLNIPLVTDHLAFSSNLVERGSIGVITGDSLDLPEVDTYYFGIFPGKRRYVKRIVGKPGDRIYFYGGDLFILEKEGKRVISLLENPSLRHLEYIPCIHFEGKTELVQGSRYSRERIIEIKQMNIPIGRVEYSSTHGVTSFISHIQSKKWIPQFSERKESTRSKPQTLGDFWGIKNFAKARLLLPQDLPTAARDVGHKDSQAVLWAELAHNPHLPEYSRAQTLSKSYIPPVITERTWIPIHDEQCKRLIQGLYTARFVVQNGMIYRYHHEGSYINSKITPPNPLEDGIYEFYHGKAYKIGFGGTAHEIPLEDPIYPKTASELLFWYNMGIDLNNDMLTCSSSSPFPTRYIYYRDGSLYSMGVPIWLKEEPLSIQFQENEILRQANDRSYMAFQDIGSPQRDSDPNFFETYGLQIPNQHYLLLGDNHAMSIDSRYFGTVPEKNIEGSPIFLFWPFGERFGRPLQTTAFPISPYSLLILSSVLGTSIVIMQQRKSRRKKTLEKLLSRKRSEK